MKIAVASGKGGTGKSTVALNLAYCASRSETLTLVDCDVEEPNLHLFFPENRETSVVTRALPVIDPDRCTLCGKCSDFCRYGALVTLPDRVLFMKNLCHSCGGCSIVCTEFAISEKPERIGELWTSTIDDQLTLITGILDEGEANAIPVIAAAKQAAAASEQVIFDAPPGTACPVIETMEACDAVALVTESTPFGLHDLKLAVEVIDQLDIPAGVVINRSDGEDALTVSFCEEAGLPILMTIPFDRRIAEIHNTGGIFSIEMPGWPEQFRRLYADIVALAGGERS
ncbi:MAG: nucleotide-binding protein [Methanoculleaceae archaeon]